MEKRLAVAVCGALGSMGHFTCLAVANDADLLLTAAVDPAYQAGGEAFPEGCPHFASLNEALAAQAIDVMVDFTLPHAVKANVLAAVRAGVACVVGTTGLSPEDLRLVAAESEQHGVPVFVAPNFALGAVLMMQFAREAARYLDACEIVELHHPRKLDAPSGTAKRTAGLVEETWSARSRQSSVPIHSVRLPGLVAHQEVIFGGLGETLTIRHDSLSRESFMPGVLLAVKRVRSLQGLVVGLENIL